VAKGRPRKETPEERVEDFKKGNACFLFKPYPWQERLLEIIPTKNTSAAISSNKIGKTAVVANIGVSWLEGVELWTMGYDGPDMVVHNGYGFKPSSLGIKPPVNILVTGEDWKSHIGKTLVPEFKKWAPQGFYTTKKNEQGVEYYWEWHNGSTMTFMSYSQDDDLFESFRIQGAIMDEPPPEAKYKAMSRGLLLDRGKTLLSLTPLKEAWILDDIVLSGRKDIGIIKDLCITDNPDLYNFDLDLLGQMGLDDEQKQQFFDLLLYADKAKGKAVEDKGAASIKYLESVAKVDKANDLKILKFIQDIDPSDVPPRVFGQFKSLVGRVLKEFDDSIHIVKPFEIPVDWPVVAMIDFHPSTPQMVSFWAVNRQDVHFCIGEIWDHGDGNFIADAIIRKKMRDAWDIRKAYIDPLSKGDTQFMQNLVGTDRKSSYDTIYNRLSKHGIKLAVASKDKDSGILNLKSMLKGPNNLPTLYIFDTCERFIYEVKRWVYDDDGKPIKENDHSMENAYRYTLVGNRWKAHQINPLPKRVVTETGAWMGA
jgi:hypothetical protein